MLSPCENKGITGVISPHGSMCLCGKRSDQKQESHLVLRSPTGFIWVIVYACVYACLCVFSSQRQSSASMEIETKISRNENV